jgi:hypothetical protein
VRLFGQIANLGTSWPDLFDLFRPSTHRRCKQLYEVSGRGSAWMAGTSPASANFITGELPIRTGLTTVGQAGSTLGMPEQAQPTLVEYPPMQAGASFNIGDLKEKVEQAIAAAKASGD